MTGCTVKDCKLCPAHCAGTMSPADDCGQPACPLAQTVRVRVTWSEAVWMEGSRELDAARMRRLGYDPADPESVQKYLNDAEDFEGDDWYQWHSEFSDVGKITDADGATIECVEIRP